MTHTYLCARTRSISVDIWPRSELDVNNECQLPEPFISPPRPATPPLAHLSKRVVEKKIELLDFSVFAVQRGSVVTSDPSKCSLLLAGCDLQAKIRDGLHSLGPSSAARHDKVYSRWDPSWESSIHFQRRDRLWNDWYTAVGLASVFSMLRPACEILSALC